MESIAQLTDRLKQTTTELMDTREQNIKLSRERMDLMDKIDNLEKEVKRLSNVIKKLAKDEREKSALEV